VSNQQLSRELKNQTAEYDTRNNTGKANSFQREMIGILRKVAIPKLRPVLEASVSLCITPDEWCCDTRYIKSVISV